MHLPSFSTAAITFLAAASSVSGGAVRRDAPRAGTRCSKPGTYNCNYGMWEINVCTTTGVWEIAASCRPGWYAWPAGYPTPFCAPP
ncbi:hypothetical protein VTJ04DRAFT_4298 [Mycothermus thermophilus]|uniref:uncharacterized protein n=1 Tax=Humicola insolens TaxID=85995 RepID=UPI003742600E